MPWHSLMGISTASSTMNSDPETCHWSPTAGPNTERTLVLSKPISNGCTRGNHSPQPTRTHAGPGVRGQIKVITPYTQILSSYSSTWHIYLYNNLGGLIWIWKFWPRYRDQREMTPRPHFLSLFSPSPSALPWKGSCMHVCEYPSSHIQAHLGHASGLWGHTVSMACPWENRSRDQACWSPGSRKEMIHRKRFPRSQLPVLHLFFYFFF